MAPQVLRLNRTDSPNEFILLHVSQTSQKALDLKLIGTEQAQLFHATLKESGVNNLQSSHFTGDLDEWKTLLRYVLLLERPKDGRTETLQGLETVAAISGGKLTVTIRKNVGGITQRLGSIRLDEDTEKEEVSGFEWADIAAANAVALRTELESLQASVFSQKDDVARLNQQLDDLVKAKTEHEDELLQKFAALLNEKKLKIRDQQRLLNGAQIDPAAAAEVGRSRDRTGRRAGMSRAGKRRANGASAEPEAEDDESNAEDDAADGQLEGTPPPSDQETEDEDGFEAPAPSASTRRKSPPIKQKDPSSMDVDEPEELPPRRELPFSRTTRQTSKQPEYHPPATDNTNNDDDETDDEL